ncbi:hypothetical protein [Deinococcus soli (ex Cha et al. 2016)]|uniref:Uncharacterized protein n=2 Tax=Deinococcus soli (ex Cha et al. 2016) TaxID=1309411 RepID=A0AAE3XBS4_9DEIO|nr:hypothetical protein [Deinococcus soli (ex Cha et al. 2016)]MDR6218592.1 hypothetical protein [Deinococcus soli (ex Cha et al. 2016)]MDR6328389.1 hypothetical protein [Deinococcus soli (ex Cha et al. 2016)]MDR6753000.1 hypothetical protein [Deinococcus soli (ex Cha et al. 2016)]
MTAAPPDPTGPLLTVHEGLRSLIAHSTTLSNEDAYWIRQWQLSLKRVLTDLGAPGLNHPASPAPLVLPGDVQQRLGPSVNWRESLEHLRDDWRGELQRRKTEQDQLSLPDRAWFLADERISQLENMLHDTDHVLSTGFTRLEIMRHFTTAPAPPQEPS